MSTPSTDPRTPEPEPCFELRSRDAEWIDRAKTLEEFARPSEARRFDGFAEVLVADAIARSLYGLDELAAGRVILTCETRRLGIPLGPRADADDPELPLAHWHARELLTGDLLDAGADGRLRASLAVQIRRGLVAAAGTVPLLMTPMLAHAGPGSTGEGVVEGPPIAAFAPAKTQKPSKTKAAEDAKAGEQPAADGDEGEGEEPAATVEPPQPQPQAQPTVTTAPAPRVDAGGLALTSDALWAGLRDKPLILTMKSGQSLAGTVVAQSSTQLAVARANDGTVVSVPKAEIAGVRMPAQMQAGAVGVASGPKVGVGPISERPTQDGRGLAGGAVAMLTIGSVAALTGTVFLAISPYYFYISLPLLLPGLAMIGGGAGMAAVAKKKKKAFNEAWGLPETAKIEFTPTLNVGRSGGQAGLVLRF